MTPDELSGHNFNLILFSAIFLVLTICLGKLYFAPGLVYAQILNMTLRILHGLNFTAKAAKEPFGQILIESLPSREVLGFLFSSYGIGYVSGVIILDGAMELKWKILCHAIIGFLSLFMVLVAIVRHEHEVRSLFVSMGAYQFIVRKIRPFLFDGVWFKGKDPAAEKKIN